MASEKSTVHLIVPDDAYAVGWNGNLEVPTKNAVYDKIETLGSGGSTTITANTGTAISLANNTGNFCNLRTIDTANANTTFTTTGGVAGGWARVLINTTSQPTITGATLQQGSNWITGTDIYMDVWSDGTDEYYNFVSLASTGFSFEDLSDVTITTIATGEISKWNGTAWVNNTLAEAGISAVGHTHTFASLTSKPTTLSGYGITDGGKPTLSKSFTIPDPVATDDRTLFYTPVAITITALHSHITGTTNVVFNIGHASTRTGTQLDVFTADITLTSTAGQTNNSGFSDATIPAGSWVWLEIVSVSGTPTDFHSTIIYTED